MRLIIAADRVIIPQDGFDQRPQFHDFVKRLLGAIVGAAAARQRREEAVNAASGPGSEQQMQGGGDDSEGEQTYITDACWRCSSCDLCYLAKAGPPWVSSIVRQYSQRRTLMASVDSRVSMPQPQSTPDPGRCCSDVKALFVDPEASPSAVASMVSEAHSYASDLLNQPFEMTALEVALKEICQSYAQSEKQLEALINPACDALLKKVGPVRHSNGYAEAQSQCRKPASTTLNK